MPNFDFQSLKQQGQRVFAGFTTGQKVVTVLAVFGVLIGGFLFTRTSHQQPYSALFTGLEATDASQITDKLTAAGTPYQLADGGKTIMVPQDKVYQVRLDMSAAGLPGSGTGYALLDKEGITTSEFRQRVDYQRALQGELERTISAIHGVQGASVHLVVPRQDVFASDQGQSSASVLLKTSPTQPLSKSQVQAVVHLVASSVEGMSADSVTVADTEGNVLSAPGQGTAGLDASETQTAAYQRSVADRVQAMLDRVVGPGHSAVAVTATLDFNQRATTSDTFVNPNGPATPLGVPAPPALEQQTTTETLLSNNAASSAIGVDGTPVAGGGQTNYSKTDSVLKNALNTTHEEVHTTPGSIVRQSVSVSLDAAHVPAGRVFNLTNGIAAAAGIQQARGDVLDVLRVPFDTSASKAANAAINGSGSGSGTDLGSMASTGGAIALVAAVLLILWRQTKKASLRRPATRVAMDLAQLEGFGQFALGGGGGEYELPLSEMPIPQVTPAETSPRVIMQDEIADLIDRQPDEVALTLRTWLSE